MGAEEIRYAAPPQSRNESILASTIDGAEYTDPPQSRVEDLLLQLKAKIEQGGGGGTSDYTNLANKPQINGTTLTGNKSGSDLGLQAEITVNSKLSSDLVDDTNATNLFVTSGEKTTWNEKQNALSFDSVPTENSTNPVTSGGVYTALNNKVDKVQGKGLSTNDFTTAEKNKLANIDANIDSAPTSGSTHPVSSGGVYDALAGKADKSTTYTKNDIDFLLTKKQNALTYAQLAAANSGITSAKVGRYDDIDAVMNYNTLNYNGIFRGKDLTNVRTIEQIYGMIHMGNFNNLFLGDYINVSITTTLPDETVKTETVSLMIAAFDYYYNCGDTALTTHHIVLIPRNQGFATIAKMNETNTTTGGYLNSYMHKTVLPCYADSLRTALNNHLLSHKTILSNAVNTSTPSMAGAGFTGASSGWEWATVELQLMNEVQVYGTTVWSSSAYDVGADNRQLPVFKFINPVHFGRSTFWLRSVVSSTNFAVCASSGDAGTSGASNTLYVRPLILFG